MGFQDDQRQDCTGDAEFTFFRKRPAQYERETIERFLYGRQLCSDVRTKEKPFGNPVWPSKKYKRELLSLTKRSRWQENPQKYIENADFHTETELYDIDYSKEMQAMLCA